MADWWDNYKRKNNLDKDEKKRQETTAAKREVSSTWWDDYKKTNPQFSEKGAADSHAAYLERKRAFTAGQDRLSENHKKDATADHVYKVTDKIFGALGEKEIEAQGRELDRTTRRYERDLPLYQELLMRTAQSPELYNRSYEQYSGSFNDLKEKNNSYNASWKKAEEDRLKKLLQTDAAAYYGETMSLEEIEAELARLKAGGSTTHISASGATHGGAGGKIDDPIIPREEQIAQLERAADYRKEIDEYQAKVARVSEIENQVRSAADFAELRAEPNSFKEFYSRNISKKPETLLQYLTYEKRPDNDWAQMVAQKYWQMTDDQKAVFHYLWAKEDAEGAAVNGLRPSVQYMNTIPGLHEKYLQRQAEDAYLPKESDSSLEKGRKVLRYLTDSLGEGTTMAIEQGADALDNIGRSTPRFSNYDTNSLLPIAMQRAGDGVGGEIYKTLGQAGQSVGRMIPSMAMGNYVGWLATVNPTAVAALGKVTHGAITAERAVKGAQNTVFYLTTKGSAMAEGREKGLSGTELEIYSNLCAISEVGLQNAIGGIAQFGGVSEKQLMSRIAQIDNVLLRTAARFGVQYGGELLEEELQNWMEPGFVTILTGDEYQAPTALEILETALSTLFMVGTMNAGDTAQYYDSSKVRRNLQIIADDYRELGGEYEEAAQKIDSYVLAMDANPEARYVREDILEAMDIMRDAEGRMEQQRTAGEYARNARQTDALRRYAEDNGLGWYAKEQATRTETAQGKDTTSTTSQGEAPYSQGEGSGGQVARATQENDGTGNLSPTTKRQERQQAREQRKQDLQIGSDVQRVQAHIQEQISGKSLQEQQEIRDQLQDKYGDGILPSVYQAISIDAAQRADKLSGSDAIREARNKEAEQIQDADMRRAVVDGYDQAVFSRAMHGGNADEAGRYFQQLRNTGEGGMTLEATVKGQDGQSRQIAITGMTEDGKGVKLADGSTVAVSKLRADADTMDAVQRIAELDMGADADAVLQAYIKADKSGVDGYRWLMDYSLAYEQGRTGKLSLEEAVQRSSLDQRTVMDAYTLGQREAHQSTRDAVESLKAMPKKQGATGRVSNIDTSEIQKESMNESELEQFEMANKYISLLGVDLVWFSSKEKNGRYVGKNGAYENGKVYMDIHAGRNFTSDLTSGIMATMSHELTHFQQQYAPKEYQALKEFLFQQIVKNSKNGELTLERLIWEKQKRSRNKLSRRQAEDEVVADACQKMLRDSKAVQEFAKENKEATNGIIQWLDKWFKKIKEIFGRGGNFSEEAQLMDSLEKDVRKAFGKLWDEALREAVEVHDRVGNIEKTQQQNSDRDTENQDIRYSERDNFAGETPVEAVRDLIAVHNMTEQNLRDVLDLGGFPSPSIAIVKAANGHTNYGPISVVFGRDSIDPALDSRNRVYGADAWTPTAANAKVDTEVNYDVRHELDRKIYELSQKTAGGKFARSALFSGFLDDVTSMSTEEILDRAARSEAALAAYLADRGETVEPVYKKNPVNTDRWGNRLLEIINEVIQERGYESQIYDLMNSGTLVKANDELTGIVREALEQQIEQNKHKVEPIRRNLQRRLDSLNDTRVEELLLNAWAYQNEGQRTEQEFDHSATVEAMKQKIDPEHRIDGLMEDKVQATVKAWLRPQIEGLLGKKGIRNERDRFTASGSERSFEALHDAYTLENIVKAMNRSAARGSNTFGVTSGSLQSVTAPEYRSVSEIKQNKNRLAKVDDARYKQLKADVETEISEITDAIYASKKTSDGYMSALDQISEALIAAARTNRTPAAIQNVFARETEYRLSKENAQKIAELYKKAAALPTEYFEAKPQRAMGFDEVKAVILPSDMDHEIVQGLQDKGVPVMFFEAGNDTQRTELLNSLDSAKFSERDYSLPSDLELMDRAIEGLSEAGGEEYWKALLETDPGLAEDVKGYKDQARKLAAAEKRLADYKKQMQLGGNRKLNTRGITSLSLEMMKTLDASDAKGRGVAKQVTQTLTSAYQKALDAIDKGTSDADAWDIVYNEGVVPAAEIIAKQGTHSEKTGRGWITTSLESYYGEGGMQAIIDTVAGYVGADFATNRYRKAIQPTIADRIVERTEKRMQKQVDAATERATEAERINKKLTEDRDFWKNQQAKDSETVTFLNERLKEARQDLRDNKSLSSQERRKLAARIKSLQTQLQAKREEIQALKSLSQQLDKQAVEFGQKQAKLLDKLEQQVQRERDILAGKLKPLGMQRLLKAEREKAEEKVKQHKDEVFQNYKERQQATELRGRIKNLRTELANRIAKPTDRVYVPAALAQSLVDVLDTLDASPREGTKAAAKYASVSESLRELARAYGQLSLEKQNEIPWEFKSEYQEEISKALEDLEEAMQGRNIRELSAEELQQVYDVVKQIRDTMRNATKLIGQSRYKDMYEAGDSVIENQQDIQRRKNDKSKTGQRLNGAMSNVQIDALSAIRAAHMIGGFGDSAIYQLWKDIEAGLGHRDYVSMESNKKLQALKRGKNEATYLKALRNQSDYGVKDVDGRTVKLTKMQAMQIYMTWQRELANDKLVHMQNGGIIVRDSELISKGKYDQAEKTKQKVKVDQETISKIYDQFTEWDKAYMQAARDVFDSLLKQSNEVLYALKHKVHKGEKNYIPERVAENYLQQEVVKGGEFNLGIKEAGATKDLVQKSTLPIIIDGLETLLKHHIGEMSNYIGLAVPIRNFAKVYNMRTQGTGVDATTVNAEIANTWGRKAGDMMMDTLRQLQNGKTYQYETSMNAAAEKLQSAFVKASLVGKISVFIKQAASYAAGGSVLSQRALDLSQQYIFALVTAPNSKMARKIYNRIDALTAEHYIRRQGMSMEEIAMDKLSRGFVKDAWNKAGAWLEGKGKAGQLTRRGIELVNPTNWIQRMDVATTAALFVACEKQAKYDGFKPGTAEYDAHLKELYERVIRETQPMYDALHRPEFQKNAPTLVKMTMPFRTVPFQNYGQIMDSVGMFQEALRNGTKAEKTAAAKHVGKTLWANFESAMVFALLGAIAMAAYHKPKKYLDDDEELTVESALNGYFGDVLETSLGNLLPYGGSELKDLVERWINGDKWYDVLSVGTVDLANTTIKSILSLKKASDKYSKGDISFDQLKTNIMNTMLQVTKMMGIPASNMKDIYTGISADLADIKAGKLTIDRSNAINARRYVKALEAGDKAKADAVLAEMKQNILADKPGLSEKKLNAKISSAVQSYFKEMYLAKEWTEANATEYMVKYGNSEDENDAYWTIREWDAREAWDGLPEEFSFSKYDHLRELVEDAEDIDEEMAYLQEHGVRFVDANKEVKSAIGKMLQEGKIDEDEAIQMLQAYHKVKDDKTKQYRADTAEEAWMTVQEWEAKAEHADEEDYSYSQYEDLREALDEGKSLKEAGADYLAHGYTEKQITDAAVDHLKDRYLAGEISEDEAVKTWAEYKGKDENEAWMAVQRWESATAHADEEDYSFSQYDAIDEAIAANKDIKALVKELTDHGVEEKNITSHVKSYLVDRYVAGGVTETALKNQLSRYLGIVAKDDVDKILNDANSKKQYGVNYSSLDEEYRAGNIKASEMKNALMKYGGLSAADAEKKIRWYDLQKSKPDLDISEGACSSWYDGSSKSRENGHESAKDAGMSIEQYLKAKAVLDEIKDSNGNRTGEDEVIAALSGMNLTARQKDALYYERYKGTTKYSRKTW